MFIIAVASIFLSTCFVKGQVFENVHSHRITKGRGPRKRSSSSLRSSTASTCEPEKIDLSDYNQWADETGYWVGDYAYYDGTGATFTSEKWNYPYRSYKGFITGNAEGYVLLIDFFTF
jgi:hypothetical protein